MRAGPSPNARPPSLCGSRRHRSPAVRPSDAPRARCWIVGSRSRRRAPRSPDGGESTRSTRTRTSTATGSTSRATAGPTGSASTASTAPSRNENSSFETTAPSSRGDPTAKYVAAALAERRSDDHARREQQVEDAEQRCAEQTHGDEAQQQQHPEQPCGDQQQSAETRPGAAVGAELGLRCGRPAAVRRFAALAERAQQRALFVDRVARRSVGRQREKDRAVAAGLAQQLGTAFERLRRAKHRPPRSSRPPACSRPTRASRAPRSSAPRHAAAGPAARGPCTSRPRRTPDSTTAIRSPA